MNIYIETLLLSLLYLRGKKKQGKSNVNVGLSERAVCTQTVHRSSFPKCVRSNAPVMIEEFYIPTSSTMN